MTLSAENKLLAQHLRVAWGSATAVQRHFDDSRELSIDIATCDDQPSVGERAYSTIGLSDYELLEKGGARSPLRIELCGDSVLADVTFAQVVAAAAFRIISSGRIPYAGYMLERGIAEHFPGTTVPHLMFNPQFIWNDHLQSVPCPTKTVTWLLVMPISDAEREYLAQNGFAALKHLLGVKSVQVQDLNRPSTC